MCIVFVSLSDFEFVSPSVLQWGLDNLARIGFAYCVGYISSNPSLALVCFGGIFDWCTDLALALAFIVEVLIFSTNQIGFKMKCLCLWQEWCFIRGFLRI